MVVGGYFDVAALVFGAGLEEFVDLLVVKAESDDLVKLVNFGFGEEVEGLIDVEGRVLELLDEGAWFSKQGEQEIMKHF